jgi:GT2 family glycosyltransferase
MDKHSPHVTVIIVYWNGIDFIDRCLKALFAQTFQDFEVILVDNGSTDGAMADIEKHWPQIQALRLDKNLGFAVANNVAAKKAKGEWLALLNSDAFPEPGWLAALLLASEEHPDLFFFASQQIQANDPHLLDGTGDEYNIGGIAWRRQYDMPVEEAVQVVDEVFSACGAAAFYPKDAFLSVGGFDEDFFSYLEDVDLGFRLRLKGFRCLYVPMAKVLHVGSASLGRESEFAIYHSQRNMAWMYLKNMPSPYFWRYLPRHILLNFFFSMYYGFCYCFCISWRAKRDALLGMRTMLRKRKEIQADIRIDTKELTRVIRFPRNKSKNPLGLIIFAPRLLYKFILAVRACRQMKHGSTRITVDPLAV